ncbi:MAG TPA: D-aminoacylase, partial [Gemmatimonadaceae bacterium]|nr:D-aminoacylase [Gemmatimonadaceae bacterium]
GVAADVVAFDPVAVQDRATFADPFQYPVGIEYVVVNGALALEKGERGAATGTGLRATQR